MANNTQPDPDFFMSIFREAHLAYRLLLDPEVPAYVKLIPAAAAVYFISPIDILPAALFGPLGAADDLGVLLLGFKSFISMSPAHIVAKHRADLGMDMTGYESQEYNADGDVIEGELAD